MANTKISDLTALTSPVAGDLIEIVDVSDTTFSASGTNKRITLTNLFATVDDINTDLLTASSTNTLTNKTIDADNNTISNLAHGAEVDNPSSGVHGVTGSVVGTSDTQTLTNKTLTSPVINVGSDAQGDIYYRNGSGVFSRLAPGTSGQFLKTNGTAANPEWASSTGIISTTQYAPQGFLINGRLSVTVASNNLTVAIKGMDGNDPSASNPVYIRLDNTTRTLTAALSVTAAAATNWFNSGGSELATKEIDYFVYIGYNATDGITLGFARIPYVRKYSEFNTTSTNEKYAKISTITTAAADDPYEVVGRFAATLSAGAGYTWTVPTYTPINLVQKPIFETRLLTWAPVFTGFSANPTGTYSYRLTNDQCYIRGFGTGTSNSATFNFTLPFKADSDASGSINQPITIVNNSARPTNIGLLGIAIGGVSDNTAKVGLDLSTAVANAYGGFTTSNAKGVDLNTTYKI